MISKPKISIGIPAYNEAANIQQLLSALINQKQENFDLLEIVVVSDASSDKTTEIIKSVNDPRIRLNSHDQRMGKIVGLNEIFKNTTGDIIVILDGDVLPKDDSLLSKLVEPFYSDDNLGIVSTAIAPVSEKNFFGKIMNFGFYYRTNVTSQLNGGDNIYMCYGRVRAFSRKLAHELVWPEVVSEDVYSYIFCKQQNYNFHYIPSEEVLFKNPDSFKDYQRQSFRYHAGINGISKFYPRELVEKYYYIPRTKLFLGAIIYFLKNPFLFSCYVAVYISARFFPIDRKSATVFWKPSLSTKKLN
ncbi:MAG TPA: glycosyltransferase family 2 protein [Patescibacteria group bacterium]